MGRHERARDRIPHAVLTLADGTPYYVRTRHTPDHALPDSIARPATVLVTRGGRWERRRFAHATPSVWIKVR